MVSTGSQIPPNPLNNISSVAVVNQNLGDNGSQERQIDTVYQNTSNKIMMIVITCDMTPTLSTQIGECDGHVSNVPPTINDTTIQSITVMEGATEISTPIPLIVLPGQYYVVFNNSDMGVTVALPYWYEYLL